MTQLVKKVDAQFGKTLLEAAKEKHNEARKNAIVDEIRQLMELLDHEEHLVHLLTNSIDAIRRRLQAVEDGNFTFEGTQLKYLDGETDNILGRGYLENTVRNWLSKPLGKG